VLIARIQYNKEGDNNLTVRELLKIIKRDGWVEDGQNGSHLHFKHAFKEGKVTVPNHKGDLAKGTIASILKHSGLK
jgi:predicted RNA binding protein YcfA (HicA-like mRNA interferase family)